MKSFEEDKTVDKSLVYYIDEHPHYKEHGAMLLLNNIWRCYGTYKGNSDGFYKKGEVPRKFIERTCNAGVKE